MFEPDEISVETMRGFCGPARDAHLSENTRLDSHAVEEAATCAANIGQLLSQMISTAENHISV